MLFIINIIFSIYINQNSVVLFNYKSNTNNTILINNVPFRETSILNNTNANIAFQLNKGYYTFSTLYPNKYLNYKVFSKWEKIIDKTHILNDIIIKNNELINFQYYSNKNHVLHISYLINLISKNNSLIKFILNIDNFKYTYYTNSGLSLYKNLTLSPGIHHVYITTKSNTFWCSCPSIKNGFQNGRYFYSWIEPIENRINIYSNIKQKLTINFNLFVINLIHFMIK